MTTLNDERVRRLTFKQDLERIDARTRDSLRSHIGKDPAEIDRRLEELDQEWPIEKALMTGAGLVVWIGLVLGTAVRKRLYFIPAVAAAMLLAYAILGWAPPVLLFRRLGMRTRGEIAQERTALKALRGDFAEVSPAGADAEIRVDRALQAAA